MVLSPHLFAIPALIQLLTGLLLPRRIKSSSTQLLLRALIERLGLLKEAREVLELPEYKTAQDASNGAQTVSTFVKNVTGKKVHGSYFLGPL